MTGRPRRLTGFTALVTADPLEIPLEAQGMSIFGANHVDGRGTHERLVADELAHQWFGNSLTVASWSDIWLHEGFACYAEWLWSECSGGPLAAAHAVRHWKRLRDLPQDLLLADPGALRMFDDRLYKRGALALHALRSVLGDKPFFRLLQSWVAANRHSSVSTGAFVAHAGKDAADVLRDWLFETSLPELP